MTLRKVIQEEISKVLQSVEETDEEIAARKRVDRMKELGDSEDQWYKNESDGNVRDQIRQIVSEEYNTLRSEPETSIGERSGVQDFQIPDGTSGRWYMDEDGEPDTQKIEEAAKIATKKLLREMGGDTFRARAENARSFDRLYEIFQDMRRFLPNAQKVLEEMAKAMGRESLEDAIHYIARMYDMQGIRQQVKDSRNTGDLIALLDHMAELRGRTENLIDDLIQQMSNPELRNMIDHFDRHYVDQMPEYPKI